MDPAALALIAVTVIINLVITAAVLGCFFCWIQPVLNRRLDRKLAHARRFAVGQKRQTITAIERAVSGFSEQARFVNDRCDTVVGECVRALEITKDETLNQVRSALTLPQDASRPARAPLPYSVEVIRKKAEDRLVEELQDKAAQPQGAA